MKFLSFIVIFTLLHSQDIEFNPILIYGYESDSEKYYFENMQVHDFEMGFIGSCAIKKLNIQTCLAYHLIQGPVSNEAQFTPVQGLHWVRKDPGLGKKQKNYYVSDIQIQYGDSASYIYFNKWDHHWGPGVRSLTVSNKIPTFPHFGFNWSISAQLHFKYFHGQLRSSLVDSSYIKYFIEEKSQQIMRNIAGHRFDWKPHKKWNVSISELVVYANRSLEISYLLPFLPFFPVQNYLNDIDNILMSVDVQYYYQKNMRIYGAFLMDEWSPPYTFQKDNHNWFGWQSGFEWSDIYLQQDKFRFEYTWTDHRIYHHRFEVNDVYSWGYPVGFWAGPHAEELYADYRFNLGDSQIEIIFSNAKRGEFTDSMREDQYSGRPNDIPVYERYGTDNAENCRDCVGTVEFKQLIRFSVYRKLNQKLDIYARYSYVNWENAEFDPNNPLPEDDLPDIIKRSIGFGFSYRY